MEATLILDRPRMLSASEMERLLNVPVGRLLRAIRAGAVTPDATCFDGRQFLFMRSRLDEVRDRLNTVAAVETEVPVA